MIKNQVEVVLKQAIAEAVAAGDLALDVESLNLGLEPPRNRQHGDIASNIAMTVAKQLGMSPRELAERITARILTGDVVSRAEIAGPGFINLHIAPECLFGVVRAIVLEDWEFGKGNWRAGERVLIEYVSSNPVGPISVVNGRAAALGSALANLLRAGGAEVSSEFYVNDALNSTQLEHLGASLAARYLQLLGRAAEVPPDGYQGEYVVDLAQEILNESGDQFAQLDPTEMASIFNRMAAEKMVEQQKKDLELFGVSYQRWFFESSLYTSGKVAAAISTMLEAGYAYEHDSALWLRTSLLTNDAQDRVLVRSTGKETYIAADAAYHKDKFDRGFNRLIDIWGADHHGYVARLKAGIAALGYEPDACEVVLTQMVMLTRGGQIVKGSKRAGDIIPLVDLIQEIGADAARYYFLLSSYETTATFDLELAKKQSADNPVFYAKYAHARCCNVLRKADEMGILLQPASTVDLASLVQPREIDLIRKLDEYPEEVRLAGDLIAPHRLTAYVRELGQALHQFYEECPALKDTTPVPLRDARLQLFNATRIVVRNLLNLLGVTSPEKM